MKISELESKINIFDLVGRDKIKKEGKIFRANPCPKCGRTDDFTLYPETNSYSSFNGCCDGGSIYKYLQEVKGMNEDQAYEELKKLAGNPTEYKKSVTNSIPHKEIEKETPLKNYTDTINKLYNEQSQEDKNYFINRGLSFDIIEKYKLIIGDIKQLTPAYYGKKAIIPIYKEGQAVFYNSRALEKNDKIKYMKAPGTATFLNIDYLKETSKDEIIIICEGEFDSLSLETIGIKSIALGGTKYAKGLIKTIAENPITKDIIFLTAFDNDEMKKDGTRPGEEVAKLFSYPKINIPIKYKDMNQWLISDKSDFKASIDKQILLARQGIQEQTEGKKQAYNNMSAAAHIKDFIGGINESVNTPAIPTGFKELDKMLDDGLYEGLYVIGAISSLGKTSWLLQVCEQIAQQDQDILYFSLEMSRAELMGKSISRLTFLNAKNKGEAKTTRGILSGNRWLNYNKSERKLIADSIQDYSTYAEQLYISEGLGTIGVKQIQEAVKTHIEITGNKPVVVIDYLQILAPYDMKSSDKQNIDKAVFELKRISREYKIPVITISSLNRASYNSEINMSAFKESGAVEYSSDVLLGLQFQNQSDNNFDVDKEKAKEKREIEVKILKNRNGATGGTIRFDYFSMFNHFIETGLKDNYKKVNVKR